MKLISLAVISFLAIGVSAYPGLGTSAADDAQQPDQKLIQDKLQELTTIEQEQEKLVLELGGLEEVEEKERETRSKMEDAEKELKDDSLSKVDRTNLEKLHVDAEKDWKKSNAALMVKQKQFKEAKEKHDGIKMKICILKENQKRQTKQDVKDHNPIGASPGSSSPGQILEKQTNEAFQEVDDLLDVDDYILHGIFRLADVVKRVKEPKKLELTQTWEKIVESRNKLMGEVYSAKSQSIHTRELQADFGWQSLSSWIGGKLRASWQEIKLREIFVNGGLFKAPMVEIGGEGRDITDSICVHASWISRCEPMILET
ncbi:hypothetical protein BASA50_009262 [Batrachochytrium salamandrivorans]|uniref:Uncharacterized protein n=1 Tax=Batrachochytrium salamandrivorans TaxID=1357716 RepID=A0ABQ8F4R9_9FUNG|nr:hypothetical protein BASA60_001302 [Batrachochytrium salamandrivorans]KAH6586929.1 hypothetical protein BASA61_006417 [Batrachochytrium salamandrivorans]KAH6590613.1 hypothetical protein BASA50_009262 [Batrachochytrium salamandrivorans]KAH9247983.1 hypothetical protein BASA81_014396 [Batrachochytrium salamandrivorans]KAH9269716.1 hypothetical protein BASA83_008188 [Batrachochytrium salamandrivorans]